MSDWSLGDSDGYRAPVGELAKTTRKPSPEEIIKAHLRQEQKTKERETLLWRDRKHRDLEVENYTLGVVATQVIAPMTRTPLALSGAQAPDTHFRPRRVTTNVPSPGFILFSLLKLANVGAIVGGMTDAWQLAATAWEEELDLPTLTPANNMSFAATFTGITVVPFTNSPFQFIVSATGPAAITPFDELAPIAPE